MQDLTFGGITRHVEQLHGGDGFHRLVIGECPDDAFVAGDFDEMRRGAEFPMSEPVGHHGIAIGQALEAGHESELDAGQIAIAD